MTNIFINKSDKFNDLEIKVSIQFEVNFYSSLLLN